MKRLFLSAAPIHALYRIERRPIQDARGSFSRLFCAEELAEAGWRKPIAQINHSVTVKTGTVRGLHYQNVPHAEMKLVSCIRGAVWDVAVDLRAGSATFLRWHAEVLSAENGYAMLIPEGFAHGFQTLTDGVELIYCHSAAYHQQAQGGLHPQDARLSIAWPRPITELSERDAQYPPTLPHFQGLLI